MLWSLASNACSNEFHIALKLFFKNGTMLLHKVAFEADLVLLDQHGARLSVKWLLIINRAQAIDISGGLRLINWA